MSEPKFIPKEKIDKKMCIHCRHCVTRHWGYNPTYLCGALTSLVDGSPMFSAQQARSKKSICGGRKWEIDPTIIISDGEKEADHLSSEYQINAYMDLARAYVKAGTKPVVSCGFLDMAYVRALNEKK